MFRWGMTIVCVFAAGVAAGMLLSGPEAGNAPASAALATPSDSADPHRLRTELQRLEEDRAMLAARNDALESEATALRHELELVDDLLQDAAAPQAIAEANDAAPTPQPQSASQDPNQDWRRGRPQPTAEQMAEFRRNFEEQQERMRQRVEDELVQMNDPNAIDNFNAITELQSQERELQRQMRDAKTDAARDELEAQRSEVRQSIRQILSSQQTAMIERMAASNGITNADAQQKFVDDFRATLDNPFFRMDAMPGGGPGRGRPRGFGFP